MPVLFRVPRQGSCPPSILTPLPRDALDRGLICPWASCCGQAEAHESQASWELLLQAGLLLTRATVMSAPEAAIHAHPQRPRPPGSSASPWGCPRLLPGTCVPEDGKCTLPVSPSLGLEAHFCLTLFIKQPWGLGSRNGDRDQLVS